MYSLIFIGLFCKVFLILQITQILISAAVFVLSIPFRTAPLFGKRPITKPEMSVSSLLPADCMGDDIPDEGKRYYVDF